MCIFPFNQLDKMKVFHLSCSSLNENWTYRKTIHQLFKDNFSALAPEPQFSWFHLGIAIQSNIYQIYIMGKWKSISKQPLRRGNRQKLSWKALTAIKHTYFALDIEKPHTSFAVAKEPLTQHVHALIINQRQIRP